MWVGCSPDCSCTLKPASCHQATRRCKVPSVCVLEESRIQFGGLFRNNNNNTNILMPHRSQIIPLAVWWGVSVVRSQKRTVVSPEPLARYLKQKMKCYFLTLFFQIWGPKQKRYIKSRNRRKNWSYSVTHLPVGLKAVEMTASVCPCRVLVQRATARTLNTACGWYTTGRTCSVSTPRAFTQEPRLDTTSASPRTKKARGTGSSYGR